jgi:hypothetical protein
MLPNSATQAGPTSNPMLSLDEALRALYVDFEGRVSEPPILVGILPAGRDLEFRQVVLDADFAAAGAAKGLAVVDARATIDGLADEVATTGACVVAWSMHEWELFERYGSRDATAVLRAAYRNAIPMVRKWRATFATDWMPPRSRLPTRGRHTLSAYMARFGCEVPPAFGPYNTGQRLRSVREMLESKDQQYARLTSTVKAKWTKVLMHNRFDCFGMRCVCLGATADLNRAARSARRMNSPYRTKPSSRDASTKAARRATGADSSKSTDRTRNGSVWSSG